MKTPERLTIVGYMEVGAAILLGGRWFLLNDVTTVTSPAVEAQAGVIGVLFLLGVHTSLRKGK